MEERTEDIYPQMNTDKHRFKLSFTDHLPWIKRYTRQNGGKLPGRHGFARLWLTDRFSMDTNKQLFLL
jgi:hypothetical protein